MTNELAEGWTSVPLNELIEPGGIFDGPFGSSLKTADYTESGVRVIRLENLANMRFVEEKRTYISKSKYADLQRHTVFEADILFGSFIDGATRVCQLPALPTLAIAKADCFTIRPRKELIDPRLLVYQLGTNEARDALAGEIHGATRPRINTQQLRGFSVALPPMPEQCRIVAKVDELLAQLSAAREYIRRTADLVGLRVESGPSRIEAAILSKAFSAELVPTEAELARAEGRDYETAEQLLARFRSVAGNKETNGAGWRGRRGRRDPLRRATVPPARVFVLGPATAARQALVAQNVHDGQHEERHAGEAGPAPLAGVARVVGVELAQRLALVVGADEVDGGSGLHGAPPLTARPSRARARARRARRRRRSPRPA